MLAREAGTKRTLSFAVVAAALWVQPAWSHVGNLFHGDTAEWWVVIAMLISLLLYLIGVKRLWRHADTGRGVTRWQAASFIAGWLVLAAALAPPIDSMGEELFSVHMVQHELLMLVAAPLLVLGRTLAVWTWGLPAGWRPLAGRMTRSAWVATPWRLITSPFSAWLLHAAALWLWHLPGLFNAALTHRGIHTLQHSSFLFSALLFWWALLRVRRAAGAHGMAVAYLFTTMLHTGALGALLTFSTGAWYEVYQDSAAHWGVTPLEDQQLGGLIMWIPGGLVYMAVALVVAARWLTDSAPGQQRAA